MEKYGVRHGEVVKYHPNGTFEFMTFGEHFTDEQANYVADLLNREVGESHINFNAESPAELSDLDRE
jgi:hypothetical protein